MSLENLFFFHILINLIILFNFNKIKNLFNIFDYPDKKRKIHNEPVPLLGGIIILINIFFFTCINFFNLSILEINIILCSIFFLVLGIIDDKLNLSPKLKFLLLIIFLIIFFVFNENMIIKQLNIYNYFFDLYFIIGLLFSILCVLLFVNALNLFDGINLQSCFYSTFFLFYLYFKGASHELILIIIITLFLIIYLNANNKIFLGNSGTLFLGCFISLTVIKNYQIQTLFQIDEIFLLMMIPGLDMLRVFVQRIYNKKNPFVGDRNHIHHYFLKIYGYKISITFITAISIIPVLLNFIFVSQIIIIFFTSLYVVLIYFLNMKIKKIN